MLKKKLGLFILLSLLTANFVSADEAEKIKQDESTDSGIKTAFGITLGKKPEEIEKMKLNEKVSENNYSEGYDVIPPKLHTVFNKYSILISKVDKTILAIRGETRFRAIDECKNNLSPILSSLEKKYGSFENKESEIGYPYYMYKNKEAYIAVSCSIYSSTLKIDYADKYLLNEAENTIKMQGKEIRYKDEVL